MTTKTTKRALALALSLALLAGLMPTMALAEEPPYSASTAEVDFGSAAPGYAVGEGDGQVKPIPITVTRTSEQGPDMLSVSLIGSNVEKFTVSPSTISVSEGNQSQYGQITIQPIAGLGTGTYEATLQIKGTSSETDPEIIIKVNFTVEESGGPSAFLPVTGVKDMPASMTAGTNLALPTEVEPSNATNKTIVWSLVGEGITAAGASVSGNTLSAPYPGTVKVKATVANGAAANTPFEQTYSITVNPASPGPVYVTGIKSVPTP